MMVNLLIGQRLYAPNLRITNRAKQKNNMNQLLSR